MLKIPMMVDRSSDEEEELGTYEWLIVYGMLFDCSDKAAELYEKAAAALEKGGQQAGPKSRSSAPSAEKP